MFALGLKGLGGGLEEFLVDEFDEVVGLGFEVLAQAGAGVGATAEFGAEFAEAEVDGSFAGGFGGDGADARDFGFTSEIEFALEDGPGFVEDALESGGFEMDVGDREAFADLTGDGEEEVGDVYVGHHEVFAGVEVDDVVALLFEVVLQFAEFGGFAAADVSGEEVVAAIVAAGDGAVEFVGEAGGGGFAAAGGGEVDVETAIALVG